MRTADIATLNMLRAKGKAGITFDNFRRGFRLGGYIFNLRQKGYKIITKLERMQNGGNMARYFLLGEKK